MAKVLIPLPDRDCDVTEVAVPWRLLTRAGHEVVFATEHGATPAADPLLLRGVIFGQLGAHADAKAYYSELEATEAFRSPLRWSAIEPEAFGGMLLPGGHAPGMRQYLGSAALHAKVADYWSLGRPVAAICHGVLVLARSKASGSGGEGKSILAARKTTCLPKYMERSAYFATFWKLGRYYRTYEAYVQDEVASVLDDPSQLVRGPRTLMARGTDTDDRAAFVVEDGRYVSARWPGDAYLFAKRFLALL